MPTSAAFMNRYPDETGPGVTGSLHRCTPCVPISYGYTGVMFSPRFSSHPIIRFIF